jgi:type IV pilus assembly protein PilC
MKPGLLKNAVLDVAEDVEGGESLSESMEKHPRVFDILYVSMVRAGEMGGVLDTIFRRLSEFMERAYKVRRQIIGAMIYPAVVVSFAVLLVTALLVFIVPKFTMLFTERKIDLPTPTAFLINLSEVVKVYWWALILGLVALAGLYVLLVQLPKVRFFMDSFKLRGPLVGGLTKKNAVSRFTRTLGTRLASGVPILDALVGLHHLRRRGGQHGGRGRADRRIGQDAHQSGRQLRPRGRGGGGQPREHH